MVSNERIVEYAWVLRELDKDVKVVLDVGCWGTYFPIMLASLGIQVYGIDLRDVKYSHPNFTFIHGDALNIDSLIEENLQFDAITIISTLEHIGILNRRDNEIDPDADVKLLKRLVNKLKSKGLILITVPVGKYKILKIIREFRRRKGISIKIVNWQKIYDKKTLIKLCIPNLRIEKIEFFEEKNGSWTPTSESRVFNYEYPIIGAKIKSIACLKLRKV